jgi:hypothetical protein
MGRFTRASRNGFQGKLKTLRKEYRDKLKDKGKKDAFDKLVTSWDSELGALTYAESITLNDYILLTSIVENRRLLNDLQERIDKLKSLQNNEEKK